MAYVNVGAQYNNTARTDIPTKAELKRTIAEDPAKVYIYSTSPFEPFEGNAGELVEGLKYTVTGPNPYKTRKWYATLQKVNGKIKVS